MEVYIPLPGKLTIIWFCRQKSWKSSWPASTASCVQVSLELPFHFMETDVSTTLLVQSMSDEGVVSCTDSVPGSHHLILLFLKVSLVHDDHAAKIW